MPRGGTTHAFRVGLACFVESAGNVLRFLLDMTRTLQLFN